MKVRVQLVVCTEEGQVETQYEVAVLEKDHQHIEQLGLTLAEAKHLLKQLQHHLVGCGYFWTSRFWHNSMHLRQQGD
jgi:hypothetical protein